MNQGLYRWFDSNGYLLYVGISQTLFRRVKEHAKTADWITGASFMTVEWFENRHQVEEAEKRAIILEAPLYNLSHKPINDRKPSQVIPPSITVDKLLMEIDHLRRMQAITEEQWQRQKLLDSRW